MKLSQKINTTLLKFVILVGFGFFLFCLPAVVHAQSSGTDQDKTCEDTTTTAQLEKCVRENKITQRLNDIVNFLSAGVGVVVVAVLIIGGIQYMTAGANPQAVTAAKTRITNALIALVVFIFTFAFLQWLVPGGIFG